MPSNPGWMALAAMAALALPRTARMVSHAASGFCKATDSRLSSPAIRLMAILLATSPAFAPPTPSLTRRSTGAPGVRGCSGSAPGSMKTCPPPSCPAHHASSLLRREFPMSVRPLICSEVWKSIVRARTAVTPKPGRSGLGAICPFQTGKVKPAVDPGIGGEESCSEVPTSCPAGTTTAPDMAMTWPHRHGSCLAGRSATNNVLQPPPRP